MGNTEQVNYHGYMAGQYDRDIQNAIPGYGEMHSLITSHVERAWKRQTLVDVLDLGCGTGLTSQTIRYCLPNSELTLVDFSEHMIAGARKKFGEEGTTYCCEDYTKIRIAANRFDIITSVIGLHHQGDGDKVAMFAKIRRGLNPDSGYFVFGDLVTFRDQKKAALAAVRHYVSLEANAANHDTLGEWAQHHMFVNKLTPLEDQLDWLEAVGFTKVEVVYQYFQTVLIIARP